MKQGAMWAVTAFFNPAGYTRRRDNYQVFRRHLGIPLITVEMSRVDAPFELESSDADVLVQIRARPGQTLWQKERLLNIALEHVPADVRLVAWLDCDIMFADTGWAGRVIESLERYPIVQVFARLYDLPKDTLPTDVADWRHLDTSDSVARKVLTHTSEMEDFRPTTPKRRGLGFGWAAQRRVLDGIGLYDAFICGSGDRAIACGAWGRFDDAIAQVCLNQSQQEHYLAWAKRFYRRVRGNVGYADNVVFHLWHGDLANRRYRWRHEEFRKFDFDPTRDIYIGPNGCWTLAKERADIGKFLAQYFESRCEDHSGSAAERRLSGFREEKVRCV